MKQYSEDEIERKLLAERALTREIREMIEAVFSERGRKALLAIDEGKVARYLDFDVVTGSTGRYVVDEDFCTCQDFVYRGGRCWHILAVRIADLSGLLQTVDGWYLETTGE